MGELHLEVIKHRLLRDFKLDVKVHNPRVSYRETIQRGAEATGRCQRQIAGQQLSAEVTLRVEPLEDPAAAPAATNVPSTELSGEHLQVVLETLRDLVGGNGIVGFPLARIKATALGAKIHDTETNDVALRIATSDAFDAALRAAGPVLLEPIMRLEIMAPEDSLGEIVGDLQQRRGIIHGTQNRGGDVVIEAEAPLATLFGYSSAIRSLSGGRGAATMEPKTYGPAPPEELKRFM
jgi:elongation factor G